MNQDKNLPQKSGKKLLLILPILALPFLALLFWALGGGESAKKALNDAPSGLNAVLPDAKLPDDSAMDKMAFYDQQEKMNNSIQPDSVAVDSFNFSQALNLGNSFSGNDFGPYDFQNQRSWGSSKENAGSNESAIRQQLVTLEAGLKTNERTLSSQQPLGSTAIKESDVSAQLSKLAAPLDEQPTTPDPEMDQLQTLMDRIYDIQHPDEVANKIQQQSLANRGTVFPVHTKPSQETIHFLSLKTAATDSLNAIANNGFYGLPSPKVLSQTTDQGFAAVVQENTTLVNGASLKLRLLQDIYVNGIHIPAGNCMTGQAQLSNDRVTITIQTILYRQSILPVKLTAYDTDGMEGLLVPGSINREVIQQSSDNVMQGIGFNSLDPSLGAQAAAAGIETAKTLFSRKLKRTKVFIKAGHQLILKDNQL